MKMYKGEKTITKASGKQYIYYEQAFDRNGVGLLIGDTVRVLSHSDGQQDLSGLVMNIIGIFEGDLMLEQVNIKGYKPYFYCWPNNVEKLPKKEEVGK